MAPIIIEGAMTTIGVEIAVMTGVITGSTDAMMTTAIDGIADEAGIIIIETMIGVAIHATTADSASSLRPVQQI